MTAPRRPPGRYDERRVLPARRLLLLGGCTIGLVALVAAYVLFTRYTGRTATAAVLGFTIVSETRVDVRFEVSKPASATTYCVVRARSRDGAQVGAAAVRVGPASRGTIRQTYQLVTTSRANTGEVDGCSDHP